MLKKGAQIMFVKNDPSPEKRYYNGMIGEITSIDEDGFTVRTKEKNENHCPTRGMDKQQICAK